MDNLISKAYDAKQLKRLQENLSFMKWLRDYKPPTPADLHRREVEAKWYERRLTRVRKVMAAYHISASALCDCDY